MNGMDAGETAEVPAAAVAGGAEALASLDDPSPQEIDGGEPDSISAEPSEPQSEETQASEPQAEDVPETGAAEQPSAGEAAQPTVPAATDSAPGTTHSALTPDGRATNDPRVNPSPVRQVKVETAQLTLFKDSPAPAITAAERKVPRASNDPRGPRGNSSAAG